MIFKETKLQGAFVIEPEMLTDERGTFARTFCRRDFEGHGLNGNISQCSISMNTKKYHPVDLIRFVCLLTFKSDSGKVYSPFLSTGFVTVIHFPLEKERCNLP